MRVHDSSIEGSVTWGNNTLNLSSNTLQERFQSVALSNKIMETCINKIKHMSLSLFVQLQYSKQNIRTMNIMAKFHKRKSVL